MIADKRLKALATLVKKDNTRISLQAVHIKGNKAEATDGHILAQTVFDEYPEEEFPQVSDFPAGDEDIYVTAEAINKAFTTAPKKPTLPILGNIKIGLNEDGSKSLVTSTDLESTTQIKTDQATYHPYPNTSQVWPDIPSDESVEITLRLEVIQQLVNLMKASGKTDPRVTLRIKSSKDAVLFLIPGEYKKAFKGLVMPCKNDNSSGEELNKHYTMNYSDCQEDLLPRIIMRRMHDSSCSKI